MVAAFSAYSSHLEHLSLKCGVSSRARPEPRELTPSPHNPGEPYKAALPTCYWEELCSIVQARISLFFHWRIKLSHMYTQGLPRWLGGKESTPVLETQETWFNPSVEQIPWKRKWQPLPVFLPGKSHKQRSLAGYSRRGHKELNTIEHTQTRIHIADPLFCTAETNTTL